MGAWIEIDEASGTMYGAYYVAPLVGAWIEIYGITPTMPMYHVAPLVGAWIEIYRYAPIHIENQVAPLVGAWIEIYTRLTKLRQSSRSSRGSVD